MVGSLPTTWGTQIEFFALDMWGVNHQEVPLPLNKKIISRFLLPLKILMGRGYIIFNFKLAPQSILRLTTTLRNIEKILGVEKCPFCDQTV